VRRLFQLGTMLLLLAVLMPISEIFDQWDSPGLSNDTQFPLFTIIFAVCLVLLVCHLIAVALLLIGVSAMKFVQPADATRSSESGHTVPFVIPPLSLVPLRI
jgi:hypothetical protein